MKKILSVLMLIALTSTLAASAAESRLQNYVDKKLAPITTKEKELNARAEAQHGVYLACRFHSRSKKEIISKNDETV